VGAERAPDGGVHFRVWAPARHRVDVLLDATNGAPTRAVPRGVPLEREPDGYHSGLVPEADVGARYR
jgi:maltooligosyltrehalose trehalohydrolase